MKFKDISEFAKWDTPEERKRKKQHIEIETLDLTEEDKKDAEQWVSSVNTKYHPENLFSQEGEKIASKLLKNSKSPEQAIKRLTFYMNRAGSNLKNKTELNKAKKILQSKNESLNESSGKSYIASNLKSISSYDISKIEHALDRLNPNTLNELNNGLFALMSKI